MNNSWTPKRTLVFVNVLFCFILIICILINKRTNVFAKPIQVIDQNSISIQPLYIYILVDDSYTANVIDRNSMIRNAITNSLVMFSSGNQWLNNSQVFINIYFYGSQYDNSIKKIWPQNSVENRVDLENDLANILGEINTIFTIDRQTSREHEDNFAEALTSISEEITSTRINDLENTLVFIVTEGNQRDKDNNPTEENLELAASRWHLQIPLGVIVYTDPSTKSEITTCWIIHFFNNLLSSTADQDLLWVSTNLDFQSFVKQVWEWQIDYYSEKSINGISKQQRVNTGNSQETNSDFGSNCDDGILKLLTLSISGDNYELTDTNNLPYSSTQSGKTNIIRWIVTTNYGNTSKLRIVNSTYFEHIVLYSISCKEKATMETTETPIDTSLGVEALTPPENGHSNPEVTNLPTSSPGDDLLTSETRTKRSVAGGIIGIILVFTLLLVSRSVGKKKSEQPLFIFSFYTSLLFLFGIVLLYVLYTHKLVDFSVDFLAGIIFQPWYKIFSRVGGSISIGTILGEIFKNARQNSKFVDILCNFSPIIGVFFAILCIIYGTIFLNMIN